MAEYKLVLKTVGGNTYYTYTFPMDMFGRRKRVYGKTEEEVLEKIANEVERRGGGGAGVPKSDSLMEHLEYYLRWSLAPDTKNKKNRQRFLVERYIKNSVIDKNINEITIDDINDFFKKLVDFISLSVIKELFGILDFTFKAARNNGRSDVISLEGVELPKKSSYVEEYIPTTEEYLMFRNYCIQMNDEKSVPALQSIIVGSFLGLKLKDVAKIKCGDIDLENNVVRVEDRTIKIRPEFKEWIDTVAKIKCSDVDLENNDVRVEGRTIKIRPEFKEWIDTQECIGNYKVNEPLSEEDKNNFLFSKAESKTVMMSVDYASLMFARIVKKCGLPMGVNTKILERNYILMLLQEGMSVSEISNETGLSIKAIKKYSNMFKVYHLLN